MKLKDTIDYLDLLMVENEMLISEINRAKKYWYILNTILRYPSLVCVLITGVLASVSITNQSESIQISILVLTAVTGILNITHNFMHPDIQIETSKHMTHSLAALNTDVKIHMDELAASAGFDNIDEDDELNKGAMLHSLLTIMKYELNKANMLKNMPSSLFMRNRKTQLISNDLDLSAKTLKKLTKRRQSAFAHFTDSEDEVRTPHDLPLYEAAKKFSEKIRNRTSSSEDLPA